MVLDLAANKEKFIQIFKGEITRPGAEELLAWLEGTDFFEAPHTGQYTLSCKGGECLHTLNRFRILSEMVAQQRETNPNFLVCLEDLENPENPEELEAARADVDQSVAIVALLAGIHIANCWMEDVKNVNVNGKWEKKPCFRWDEEFMYGRGEKSVFIMQNYMRLYVEEAQAIRFYTQGKDVAYSNMINDTYYQVYETNLLASMLGAAENVATNVHDRIIWEQIKPR